MLTGSGRPSMSGSISLRQGRAAQHFLLQSLYLGLSCRIFFTLMWFFPHLVFLPNPIAGCIIPYLVPSLFTVNGSGLFILAGLLLLLESYANVRLVLMLEW